LFSSTTDSLATFDCFRPVPYSCSSRGCINLFS